MLLLVSFLFFPLKGEEIEWRYPYKGIKGVRTLLAHPPSKMGSVIHRTLFLRSNFVLLPTMERQPELYIKQPLQVFYSPSGFSGAPLIYGTIGHPPHSTFLYIQNLSTLGELMDSASHLPSPPVVAKGQEIGWQGMPIDYPLKVREDLPISDAYLLILPQVPKDAQERAEIFLRMLDALLPLFSPAGSEVKDWEEVAETSLEWLERKGNWSKVEGKDYLLAYVNAPWQGGELITQLEILEPLLRYQKEKGKEHPLFSKLKAGLTAFYQPSIRSVANNLPFDPNGRGDSWYLMLHLVKLADMACLEDEEARQIFRDSLPYAIKFAHNVNYRFPVFHAWRDAQPLGGEERDAIYGYLYAMVRACEIFGEESYLREAEEAAKRIGEGEFYSVYELHLEAIGCAGLARLARLSGDKRYLKLSLRPLAYLLAHCALYQANWGFRLPTFMALSAMPGIYCAPMETHLSVWYLREWLRLGGVDLPIWARRLGEMFIRFNGGLLRYAYPDKLSLLAKYSPAYNFPNDPTAPIPVEDYRWDLVPPGQWGQEIYGAGCALDMALLSKEFSFLRSGGEALPFVYPRGFSLKEGESSSIKVYHWRGEMKAELDAPKGIGLRQSREGLFLFAKGIPPGTYRCILWLKDSSRWRPYRLEVHILPKEPIRWRAELLRDLEVWSFNWNDPKVGLSEKGLKVSVSPGRNWAVVAIPDLLLPPAREVRVKVEEGRGRALVKLSGDWNGDGRWPGDFDDWVFSLGEGGEFRSPLPLYIQDSLSHGIPLRYLQLAVEGGEGSYAIFSDIEFLP